MGNAMLTPGITDGIALDPTLYLLYFIVCNDTITIKISKYFYCFVLFSTVDSHEGNVMLTP